MASKRSKMTDLTVLQGHLNENFLVQKCEPLLLMRTVPFSLGELKVLDTYISRLNSHQDNCTMVTFTKAEYEELMGLTDADPRTLRKYTTSLLSKIVDVPFDNGDYFQFVLFDYAAYRKDDFGRAIVELSCTERAKKLFFQIEQLRYLEYELKNVINLTGKYSYLLYLYLKKNIYRSTWSVPFVELRDKYLDLKNRATYSTFKYFKRDILDKAIKEINEKTDINFTYDVVKAGKSVTDITFHYLSSKNTLPEPFDENQLTFDDVPEQSQTSDVIAFLSDACNNEFTPTQMQEIFSIISIMDIPPISGDTERGRYHFLMQIYSKLQAQAEQNAAKGKPIQNRYKYFLKILKSAQ